MRIFRKSWSGILKLTVIVVLLYSFLKLVLIPLVISDQFINFTASLGFLGYFVVIGYTVLSHVFVPLAGTPAVILGVTIYGLKTGMTLLYLASLLSATINFYISRKYGRKLVIKLVGKKIMNEVDEFASVEGRQVLLISRIFGFPIFDIISYAAGLTKISFKEYFLITATANLFTNVSAYYVFRNIDFQSETGVTIWIVSILVAGIIFGLLIKSYVRKKTNSTRRVV